MKIDVAEDRSIRLRDVFNSVIFETEEGEKIAICMRDGGFEMGIKDPSAKDPTGAEEEYYSWYRIMNGQINPLSGASESVTDQKKDGGKDES